MSKKARLIIAALSLTVGLGVMAGSMTRGKGMWGFNNGVSVCSKGMWG